MKKHIHASLKAYSLHSKEIHYVDKEILWFLYLHDTIDPVLKNLFEDEP
ncbi:hypothetical protein P618_201106 [Holospora obtusa F1]|uniref:Uncharacterized protein n=1 Tax=Holospora obtusa F1 TaxID=1399147 RepID=W6TD97_HOLOB|nr:hypothetical protein [Holospora obtusa]ETZ06701.1 hypothetical protein P618_201106 [Holospora obtusa F1]